MNPRTRTMSALASRAGTILILLLALAAAGLAAAQDDAAAGDDAPPAVEARLVAEGLVSPVLLVSPPNDERRFVVDQSGTITILDPDGTMREEPFLDLTDRIVPLRDGFEERGLLGLAFHPRFADNGRLYVHYSAPLRDEGPGGWDHTAVVSEFTVPADAPEHADPASERIVLQVDHPNRKTNGGAIAFGPGGYLHVAMGEGGGAHGIGEVAFGALEVPERGNVWDALAQDTATLYGKILRLDVDRGWPGYAVPPSNPFVGTQGRDEIYAWGFRNPYRMAFDMEGDGALYVAAVSESLAEAIYRIDGPGNYGWPIREGTRCYDRQVPLNPPDTCPATGPRGWRIVEPVIEYFNLNVLESDLEGEPLGTAVVGGHVYRGDDIPGLQGRYVFADYSADPETPSGTVFAAGPEGDVAATWPITRLVQVDARAQGMGQDAEGELYLLTREAFAPEGDSGRIYRLVAGDDADEDAKEGDSQQDEPQDDEAGGADAPAADAEPADAEPADDGDTDGASGEDEAETDDAAASGDGDGLFTAEQAARGSDAYDQHCQSCHAGNLQGQGPFPPLTGSGFFGTWEGRSVGELFTYVHDFMPLGAGGSLEDETYADTVAYWLSRHGYEPGESELPASADAIPEVPVEDRR